MCMYVCIYKSVCAHRYIYTYICTHNKISAHMYHISIYIYVHGCLEYMHTHVYTRIWGYINLLCIDLLGFATHCHAVICGDLLCAMLCYYFASICLAMHCYALLCLNLLCFALPSYAMLRYALPCYALI